MPRMHGRCGGMQPSTSKAAIRKKQAESSDDGSDSDYKQNATTSETTADISTLVTNFVKYVINYASTKVPIKRPEMSKALNILPKDFALVCKESKQILKNVYGLDLVEVPESKSGKQYMICSKLPTVTSLEMPLEQRRESTVLFITLALIFMKGGEINEEALLQFFDSVPLHYRDHEKDEEVKKHIKTFAHQLYIKRLKVDIEGKNTSEMHLSWGPRAEVEFDKKKVLESVCKIIQKSPLSFYNQYTEAFGPIQEDVIMAE